MFPIFGVGEQREGISALGPAFASDSRKTPKERRTAFFTFRRGLRR
jgi:hypothetical protein